MSARQELLLAEASRLYKSFCEQPERFSASRKDFSSKTQPKEFSDRRSRHATSDADSSTMSWAHQLIQRDARALTLKDRVAAHALVVNNQPRQSLHSLEELVRFAKGSSKRESVAALDALAGLWIDPLLPSDRKLSKLDSSEHALFIDQQQSGAVKPADKKNAMTERKLVLKYYEHRLKELFVDYISVLDTYLQDPQVQLRKKAMSIVHQLLRNKPEQEQRLLALLVNKLGDPDRKLASNAMFYLNRLSVHHPLMAPFIVDEIGRFIFRPNLPIRAQYYALCFLNTLELPEVSTTGDGSAAADSATSVKMLQVYFTLFKSVYAKILEAEQQQNEQQPSKTGKKKKPRTFRNREAVVGSKMSHDQKNPDESAQTDHHEEISKLFSALLSGVNRAFAAVPAHARESTIGQLLGHTDALFKLVHTCQSFPATMQILLLLQQLCLTNADDESDIITVNVADESEQNTNSTPLRSRFYAVLYRKLAEPEILEHQSSRASKLLLNILYKSMVHDVSAGRVRAVLKRTLQLALAAAPHFSCALLVVIDEVLRKHPHRSAVMRTTPKVTSFSAGSGAAGNLDAFDGDTDVEDEVYADAEDGETALKTEIPETPATVNDDDDEAKPVKSSWVHTSNQTSKKKDSARTKASVDTKDKMKLSAVPHAEITSYDFAARNPQYAGAEYETFWELAQLSQHAHPSVAIMAQKLLSGTNIDYSGNPLDDFATIKFLDRFVNRNPKKKQQDKKVAQQKKLGVRAGASQFLDLTSTQYARLPVSQVPPEEQFLHTFAQLRASKRAEKDAATKRARGDDDDEIESVADDEFDAYLERFEQQQGDMYDKDADLGDEDADELEEIDFSEAMKQAGLETLDFNQKNFVGDNELELADGEEFDGDSAVKTANDADEDEDDEDDDDDFPGGDSDDDEEGEDKRGRKRKFNNDDFDLHGPPHKRRGRRGGGRRKRH